MKMRLGPVSDFLGFEKIACNIHIGASHFVYELDISKVTLIINKFYSNIYLLFYLS